MNKEDVVVGGKYLFIFRKSEEDKDEMDHKSFEIHIKHSGEVVTVTDLLQKTVDVDKLQICPLYEELHPIVIKDNV